MASAAVATTATSSSSSTATATASSLGIDQSRETNTASQNLSNSTTVLAAAAAATSVSHGNSSEQSEQVRKPQHDNTTATAANTATVPSSTELKSTTTTAISTPSQNVVYLSASLKRILLEVARTGSCSWLSWHKENETTSMPSASSSSSTTGIAAVASSSAIGRQNLVSHRRSQPPPRKRHRNGLHKSRRRIGMSDSTTSSTLNSKASKGRKRPLLLIRTNQNYTTSTPTHGSVGSGRTSASEMDDSTHYECDSEGTTTTSNSEMSVERIRKSHHFASRKGMPSQTNRSTDTTMTDDATNSGNTHYRTLQAAIREALTIVLDHFYEHHGGYKLSAAEKRWIETSSKRARPETTMSPSEAAFRKRRQRLIQVLTPPAESSPPTLRDGSVYSAPFTIQRIAEVLVSPQRYYTQTHKLCNCLEKLLLVRSSTEAFGGSRGGDTSQTRLEERELAALADERERQESERRLRRNRRISSSPSGNAAASDSSRGEGLKGGIESTQKQQESINNKKPNQPNEASYGGNSLSSSQHSDSNSLDQSAREILEAEARASLRNKFDHVGHHNSPERDVRSMENRSLTNSPPPPSLQIPAAPPNLALPGHLGVAGFARPNGDQDMARIPSPILFSSGNDSAIHSAAAQAATTNMQVLQLHHAVALAGVSLGRGSPSSLDLMALDSRHHNTLGMAADNGDGRSSASNSDVDSESDDISLDDSASDRSDGSDSGSVTYSDPFSAARAMARNRFQQQQRLQSRNLTSMHSNGGEGFRPPADSEYQSGDSIDSTRADDSGGSDSSSSDLAD